MIGSSGPALTSPRSNEQRRTCRPITQGPLALGDLEGQTVAEFFVVSLFEQGLELVREAGRARRFSASAGPGERFAWPRTRAAERFS